MGEFCHEQHCFKQVQNLVWGNILDMEGCFRMSKSVVHFYGLGKHGHSENKDTIKEEGLVGNQFARVVDQLLLENSSYDAVGLHLTVNSMVYILRTTWGVELLKDKLQRFFEDF